MRSSLSQNASTLDVWVKKNVQYISRYCANNVPDAKTDAQTYRVTRSLRWTTLVETKKLQVRFLLKPSHIIL